MTDDQPFKSRTWLRVNNNLIPTYSQCYEFDNKSEMLFFVSSKRKEEGVLEVSWFQIKRGKVGNRRLKYYVSVYTPRIEK